MNAIRNSPYQSAKINAWSRELSNLQNLRTCAQDAGWEWDMALQSNPLAAKTYAFLKENNYPFDTNGGPRRMGQRFPRASSKDSNDNKKAATPSFSMTTGPREIYLPTWPIFLIVCFMAWNSNAVREVLQVVASPVTAAWGVIVFLHQLLAAGLLMIAGFAVATVLLYHLVG
ncbi:hypothetical protein F5Y16DRAFT_368365 [Xylariaceae sp. FL0255]|nr:hypothetical protein F5Y16DRAFT_368365 [Xylariaceae sp. FL0255]